jgi:parvulin-like peptidyl-prolyl isomerase
LFDEAGSRVLVQDPLLTNSVFTNLYFLEGKFSKNFQLFYKTNGIYVYKVKWDGTADNNAGKNASVGEEVQARHILVSFNNRTEEQAKKLIDDIAKNATVDNFAELAKKYSDDPGSAANGGELGWFGKGQMVPEFENASFSTPVGNISKPVRTQFGYHIILVEGKR